jgi:hypothetical protein
MSSSAESVAMSAATSRLVRRVWRAPQNNRTAVIDPPWADAANTVAINARRSAGWSGDLLGKSWTELRAWSRTACLTAAHEYLAALGVPCEANATDGPLIPGPLIVDGHQPELFHPGVWAKNFAVQSLARRTGGRGLHLIVDNDTLPRTAIRVPMGDVGHPQIDWLPFDEPQAAQPWEEVRVSNPALFASFAERVAEAMRPWSVEPVLPAVWDRAVAVAGREQRLVDGLTVARITAEWAWGAGNLELPLSRLCVLPPFLWFVAALLSRADEFARHHNEVLAEYRRLNRIRSRSHPVPELVTAEEWIETPFWIWRAGETHRQRVFVRLAGPEIHLRGTGDLLAQWPASDGAAAVEALQSLAANGWRLRTRALATTLFARLCLADLFVHGLGGAKYDEMTDALLARFYGVQPPEFLTVTATVHLPLGELPPVSANDLGGLKHLAWDLTRNPQRHLGSEASAADRQLVIERQQLVQRLLTETDRRQRSLRRQMYRRVRAINAELAARLDSRRQEIADEIARREHRRAANRILQSREYCWGLYPAELLRGFYAELFGGPDHG